MKNILLYLTTFFLLLSCSQDDNSASEVDMMEELVTIPRVAIVGGDLTTGDFPFLMQWDENYEGSQTDFLPDFLNYDFGFFKNINADQLAVASGFPVEEFITYTITTDEITRYSDFFIPQSNVAVGETFILNIPSHIVTFYRDAESTCCNSYLNSYATKTGLTSEYYLGNIDVSPVQFNTFVRDGKAFVTGVDTFTGVKKLVIYDLVKDLILGSLEVVENGGYFYNDINEQVYLFDFNGAGLSYQILDLKQFAVGEVLEFPQGVTASSGFNDARFEGASMIFKQDIGTQSTIGLTAIFNLETEVLISYEGTSLINAVFEETGKSIRIEDTAVNLKKGVYVLSGTYLDEEQSKGLIVFMTLDQEIIQTVETGIIDPAEIIFLD